MKKNYYVIKTKDLYFSRKEERVSLVIDVDMDTFETILARRELAILLQGDRSI